MVRPVITYLMIFLIALQSVIAMADTHQLHQSGTEHLSFESHQHEHDEALPSSDTSIKVESMANDAFDCHHCCHCHGVVHFSLQAAKTA